MKKTKLYFLFTALLFAGSAMAAETTSYIPTAVHEVVADEILYTVSGNETVDAGETAGWIVFPYEGYSDQKPLDLDGSQLSSKTSCLQVKTGGGVFNSDQRVIHLLVTGVTGVVASGSAKENRGFQIGATEYTAGMSADTEMKVVAGNTAATNPVSYNGLDAKKTYIISVFAFGGDTYLYAIKLIAVQSPTLTSFTINEVKAVIDDEAQTITALLPYGTTIDWESVAVVLGGNATQWTISDDHTTLTISNEDASQKVIYTLNITVDTTVSHDATLSEITLDGKSLADFAAATKTYTVELAYIDAVPAIEATPTNAAAQVVVDAPTLAKGEIGTATITVTAQDGTTIEVYTINFTRAAAEVAKLYEVIFSNNAKGAIDVAKQTVTVPYLADTEEAMIPTTEEKNITVQGAGAIVALNENNEIVMTSADDTETVFTIVGAPLVPKELGNDTVTFDGNEVYIFAPAGMNITKGYGWVANKNVEEETNPRITSGKCRMYIALPACDSVTLFIGTPNDRKAELYVNGVDNGEVTFPKSSKYVIKKGLSNTSANFIGIENHSSGDLGFTRILLSGAKDIGSAFDQTQVETKAVKVIRDGQLLIIREGKTYTAQGVQVQ